MANLQNELAQVQHISGELHTNAHAKIGMVVGRFNSFVVESLVSGAIDTLLRHGIAGSNITVVRVPGAWEIPLAVARMAQTAKGLGAIGLDYDVPVINAILTTDSIEQAIERSGTKAGNKGSEAAMVALEMINVLGQIDAQMAGE